MGTMNRTLTASLVAELRAMIIDGTVAPGDKLPSESELIARHGVSRTVVREAIARLQAEGLVQSRRGAGSFALVPPAPDAAGIRPVRTLEDRRALLEFRLGVEPQAAALAALRRSPAHLAAIGGALAGFAASMANPAEAMRYDFEFHQAVAQASGNAYYAEALARLGPTMIAMPRARLGEGSPAYREDLFAQSVHEHAGIRDAIADADPEGAAAAMRAHLSASRRRLAGGAGQG